MNDLGDRCVDVINWTYHLVVAAGFPAKGEGSVVLRRGVARCGGREASALLLRRRANARLCNVRRLSSLFKKPLLHFVLTGLVPSCTIQNTYIHHDFFHRGRFSITDFLLLLAHILRVINTHQCLHTLSSVKGS